ncbi:hypothetical protein GSI_05345 [Ganoderma sinense ZZ0214-1]|uniref:Uncharacterized protein n=1 Tax=Ganoderma sinense ZZ0214-1 TaxID=1077348 RepID=A0A2G8SFW9_9APHY|nr:hypothetical protein GSI_05345 [Ganoderma sinense ZZ0214-1]
MHASALSNVARRRLVHGVATQTAAASTSANPIQPASTVLNEHHVVPPHASRSRKVVRDSNKNITASHREPSRPSATYRISARQLRQGPVPTSLLSSCTTDKLPSHARALHTSARRQNQNQSQREDGEDDADPIAAWRRPHRPSQDAHDDVVPSYYVERKNLKQTGEEEAGLMHALSTGILGDGLAAETRAREEKMPVEVRLPDGTVAHPSGFEPPTAETEFHPIAAKVDTEEHPLVATLKQPWGEAVEGGAEPIVVDKEAEVEWVRRMVSEGNGGNGVVSGVSDIGAGVVEKTPSRSPRADDPDNVVPQFYVERKLLHAAAEGEEVHSDLMHELGAGLRSDEVAAQMRDREEKIPVEVVLDDGSVAHPSGFVPPTAETDFHPVAAKTGDVPKQPWIEVLGAGVEGQNGSA